MASPKSLLSVALLLALAAALASPALAHSCPTNCTKPPAQTDVQMFFSPNVTILGLPSATECETYCETQAPFGSYYQYWINGLNPMVLTCTCFPKCCLGNFVKAAVQRVDHGVYCTVPACIPPP